MEEVGTSMDHGGEENLTDCTAVDPEDELGYNPQINCGYDPQLRDDRRETKNKLRRRFEHIYEKYGRNFEGIADEIDLTTGEIVVNNGHLQHMQYEADVGVKQSSNDREDDGGYVTENRDGVHYDADSDEEGSSFEETSGHVFSSRESTVDSDTSLFDQDESAPEEASTLYGTENVRSNDHKRQNAMRQRKSDDISRAQDVSAVEDASDAPSANDLLDRVPGLKESVLSLQAQYRSGRSMDQDAIHALGMSIANQLAGFISNGGQSRMKKCRRPSVDNPRMCSDPSSEPPAKRQRRGSNPMPGTLGPSPGEKSIWAPIGHPRQQTRKRKKDWQSNRSAEQCEASEQSAVEAQTDPEDTFNIASRHDQVPPGDAKSCSHCNSSDSCIWRKGPNGLLCNTCGMYFYRYGLLKPMEASAEETQFVNEDSEEGMDPLLRDWLDVQRSDQKHVKRPIGVQNARFTLEEDASLIKFKEIEGFSWEGMVSYFPGRSATGLQCRYSKKLLRQAQKARELLLSQGYKGDLDSDGVIAFSYSHEPFTDAEDELLLTLRGTNGLDWEDVALSFEKRSPAALEQRYLSLEDRILEAEQSESDTTDRPRSSEGYGPVRHPRYTYEEDSKIIKLRETDKMTWERMADLIPGRHAASLQKRYIRELCGRHPESIMPSRKAYDHESETLRYHRRQPAIPAVLRPENFQNKEGGTPDTGVDAVIAHELSDGGAESLDELLEQKSASRNHAVKNAAHPVIEVNLQPFTLREDKLIVKLRELDDLSWPNIAEHLPDRKIEWISDRYYHHLLPEKARVLEAFVRGAAVPPSSDVFDDLWTPAQAEESASHKRWTTRETDILVALREQGEAWTDIATRLPGRTARAVEGHYAMILGRTKTKKRLWRAHRLKSKKPLLRQAVKNSRRRSESAGTSGGSAHSAKLGEETRSIRPRPYKLLLPNPISRLLPHQEPDDFENGGELSRHSAEPELPSASTPGSPLLEDSVPAEFQRELLVPADGLALECDAGSHTEVKMPAFDDRNVVSNLPTDSPSSGRFDECDKASRGTPMREQQSSPMSIKPSPISCNIYDTPARFNAHSHPYFVHPMTPCGLSTTEELYYQADFQHPQIEEPVVVKATLKTAKERRAQNATTKQQASKERPTSSRISGRRKKLSIEESTDHDGSDMAMEAPLAGDGGLYDVTNTDKERQMELEADQFGAEMQLRREEEEAAALLCYGRDDEPNVWDIRHPPANAGAEQLTQHESQEDAQEHMDKGTETKGERPPYSYSELITLALTSEAPMTTQQIYNWLEREFSWCRSSTMWRSRVRAALSGCSQFEKVIKNSRLHGVGWILSDAPKEKPRRKKPNCDEVAGTAPAQNVVKEEQSIAQNKGAEVHGLGQTDSASPKCRTSPKQPRSKTPRRSRRWKETTSSQADDATAFLGDEHDSRGLYSAPEPSETAELPDLHRVSKQHEPAQPRISYTKRSTKAAFVRDSESVSSVVESNSSVAAGDRAELHYSAPTSTTTSSSSPIMAKQRAPSITYRRTPRSGTRSTLLRDMHKRELQATSTPVHQRGGAAAASANSRADSVTASGGKRRMVYTPAREVGDSEDELA